MKTREVNLVSLQKPNFLSLVGLPANRTGFSKVRSEPEQETKPVTHHTRNPAARVRKRSDLSGNLVYITLPEGLTEEQAADLVASFGLADEFKLTSDENGCKIVKRADVEIPEQTIPIQIGNGIVAHMRSTTSFSRSDATTTGVAVVGLRFDGSNEEAVKWCEEHGMEDQGKLVDAGFLALRAEQPGTDTKEIRLDDGVVAIVMASAENDVPQAIYSGVIEQSYGSYGWGQLDFSALMADREFSHESSEAVYALQRVLDNILLYNDLPLDARKQLVNSACAQFAAYTSALIDSLPRGVLTQARADKPTASTEAPMSEENKSDMPKPAPEPKKDDLAGAVVAGIMAAVTEMRKEVVTESKPEPTPTPETPPEPKADPGIEALRSDLAALRDLIVGQNTQIADLKAEVEGTVALRSEPEEVPAAPPAPRSVFRGILNNAVKAG